MHRRVLAITIVILLSLAAEAQLPSVPESRFTHLRHGINASEWFAQASEYTPERLRTYTTLDDIALIRRLGFDHIRLSIDPQPLWHEGCADSLPSEYLTYLDQTIDAMLAQGLAVIVDIHPSSAFKHRLASENQFAEQFADFWRALARHYSGRNPDYLFFELLNEPEIEDGYRWYGLQAKLIAAVREGAPQHTIIAAGHRWSDIYELLFLEPYADGNIIYNFHFYDPHIFTHQGATWGVNSWHYLHNVPYPSTAKNVQAQLEQPPIAVPRMDVLRYGLDGWNRERIAAEIAQAAQWARQYNLRITCNEFGVFREHSDPQARAAWIRNVRTALEENGIGWTMWDYQGGFGVVTKPNGRAVPDATIVDALGLRSASRK